VRRRVAVIRECFASVGVAGDLIVLVHLTLIYLPVRIILISLRKRQKGAQRSAIAIILADAFSWSCLQVSARPGEVTAAGSLDRIGSHDRPHIFHIVSAPCELTIARGETTAATRLSLERCVEYI
jgi:hypothetical protein